MSKVSEAWDSMGDITKDDCPFEEFKQYMRVALEQDDSRLTKLCMEEKSDFLTYADFKSHIQELKCDHIKELQKEYGEVKYPFEEVALTEHAYLSGGDTDYYEAAAIDANDNEYEVRWEIIDAEIDDESMACDWEDYTITRTYTNQDN